MQCQGVVNFVKKYSAGRGTENGGVGGRCGLLFWMSEEGLSGAMMFEQRSEWCE